MSITLTTIPEQTADWPQWLDQQLMEFRLSDLVDELRLLNAAADTMSLSLNQILTDAQRTQVLESGTSALSLEQFRVLFGHPDVLLELQEQILETGGDYWNRFPESDEMQTMAATVFEQLNLSAPNGDPVALSVPAKSADDVTTPAVPASSRSRLTWIVSTIAVALLAVTVYQLQPDRAVPTGLGNPALLTAQVESAQEWFDAVASAGQSWKAQEHTNEQQLLRAIQQVSDACGRLIDSPNPVLDPAERAWFVQKCQNWKTKLDDTHAALAAGELSFAKAKIQADGIMTKLVDVLKAGPAPEDVNAMQV